MKAMAGTNKGPLWVLQASGAKAPAPIGMKIGEAYEELVRRVLPRTDVQHQMDDFARTAAGRVYAQS